MTAPPGWPIERRPPRPRPTPPASSSSSYSDLRTNRDSSMPVINDVCVLNDDDVPEVVAVVPPPSTTTAPQVIVFVDYRKFNYLRPSRERPDIYLLFFALLTSHSLSFWFPRQRHSLRDASSTPTARDTRITHFIVPATPRQHRRHAHAQERLRR